MNRRWHLSQLHGYLELGMDRQALAELRLLPAEVRAEAAFLAVALQLHQKAERWPSAVRTARQLVRLEAEEAGWWIALAYATRRSRSIAAARRILLEAEALHPAEPTIQFNLACYAAQSGELDEARTRLAQAITRESGFAELARNDPDLEPLRRAAE